MGVVKYTVSFMPMLMSSSLICIPTFTD